MKKDNNEDRGNYSVREYDREIPVWPFEYILMILLIAHDTPERVHGVHPGQLYSVRT